MLGIRWTIGDVNPRGFHALRLSVWGAWRLFGASARYRIHVNTIRIADARARTGELPTLVEWEAVQSDIPACLADYLDRRMAEGVAWKLVPLRAFPDDHELALENDVVLWDIPKAVSDWLVGRTRFLLGEEPSASFGAFADQCGKRPLATAMRGLPPGFALETALADVLSRRPVQLVSESDVQGLQIAALAGSGSIGVVGLDDVTICSPFPPHVPHLGKAGAHFVRLNTRKLGFTWNGRAAELVRAQHWDAHASEVARRVGV